MTLEEYDNLIKSNEYVLVDFFATWCMPCKMQSVIIAEFKDKNISNLTIQKIDVDVDEDVTNEMQIVSVPTLILYKNGKMIKRHVGIAQMDNIMEWLNS